MAIIKLNPSERMKDVSLNKNKTTKSSIETLASPALVQAEVEAKGLKI